MQQLLQQLTLSLSIADEATFANFYAANNSELITQLQKAARAWGNNVIYLSNPRHEGASHLLQASCYYAYEHGLKSVYLPLKRLHNFSPDILHGLEAVDLVCIDDLHVIAKKPIWEEALFHLYNRLIATQSYLIVSAIDSPRSLGLSLADLESRLLGGIVYNLHALTDDDKLAILTLRAEKRGIHLPEEVGKYILNHCPRQLNALLNLLNQLDQASLAAQRKLTIPFVKNVIENF